MGFRAVAAFTRKWSRTWSYVARHVGVTSGSEILAINAALATEWAEAAVSLGPHVPRLLHVPWENGGAPTTGSCKSTPLQYADAFRKKVRLENLSSTMAAARYRSCGGPGAGGFLLAPADDSVWMEDTQSKSAIVCRLGGILRLVADSGTALCQHEGAAGTCMTCLDLDGIHSSICPCHSA